mmetsp:Transcript_4523/g.14832  ORF Transcript_4523/g.14832 Transcript_4523/m.14832 type:complete len:152 (+) Transcript_4523:44-499(+)
MAGRGAAADAPSGHVRPAGAAPEDDKPSKKIRSALETMLGAAQTGDALPATDLDSHERLVHAWVQYRDMYGNNALASGGGKRLAAADDQDEHEEQGADAADLSRQPGSALDAERAVAAEVEAPAVEMAAPAPAAAAGSGAAQPCDISMWAP